MLVLCEYDNRNAAKEVFPYQKTMDLLMEKYKLDCIKARYMTDDLEELISRAYQNALEWVPNPYEDDD